MAKGGGGKRPCDYCGGTTALLYCRADTARLCFACDREVHATNPLFAKHNRSLLCDACDSASASFFCEAERLLLCQNCDWDRHDGGRGRGAAAVHNRRPVEVFTGSPSVGEILGILGVEDLGFKGPPLGGDEGGDDGGGGGGGGCGGGGDGGFSDVLLWDTPAFVTLDDLIVPREDACALRAVDVPPLPKNRNATCGLHMKEMLRQLRLLAKPEYNFNFEEGEIEPLDDFHLPVLTQALQPANIHTGCEDRDQGGFQKIEATDFQWFSNDGNTRNQAYDASSFSGGYKEERPTALDKYPNGSILSSTNECHEVPSENSINPNPLPLVPLTSQERESAISRYKEKRKTRRYDKHIRYESRKVRAESRIRIKGRFAKTDRT
ncbi:LOW QUALITY PROTEIN: zinc finger protein CONSTANS-LIKE 13 [Eucalyptus grandis]|uniref:LOW QUALITY PROTEIN: zinc finger protein CONSTANS-LIKE 13 n=1 Tax=Eucalyptus grandis TaxID=71139 RepID=UPI00192F07EC|nr:LOW QUALITY PROTEIN: zinc finger protein CONSTANS-LIKE 13 [Eucalyptus grandis]